MMKKLVLSMLWLLYVGLNAYGQDPVYNFQVIQGELHWQKIFNTTLSFAEVSERLKEAGLLSQLEMAENKVMGDLKGLDADYRGAGFSEMATPMYIARSRFTGFLLLEYKDGRYRVVLRKIGLGQRYNDPLSNQGEITSLETYALNSKGEMTNAFKKAPCLILDYTFSKTFDFNFSSNSSTW